MTSVSPIEFIGWCFFVLFLDAAVGAAAIRELFLMVLRATCKVTFIGILMYCLRGRHSQPSRSRETNVNQTNEQKA